MKLIQAMKQIQDLQRKLDDLKGKIAIYCADLSFESPLYENQKQTVSGWIQSGSDILKEILRLRIAVQKTNLETQVSIELNGKTVTKSIAEWIHRRRDLATSEYNLWSRLTDKNLKEGLHRATSGVESMVTIRRYFDPAERDSNMELYRSEPSIIDSNLEVVNAVTDLIEN